ncbi:hypothetical protein C5S32_08130 [ANME-1 cluster archaeon GoMg1]|nr:hypothetical protein [ANME-1 cluster archaeon GoMg1]
MRVAAGTVEYTLGVAPVSGHGFSWNTNELDAALTCPVSEVVFDDSGKADISKMLYGLVETDFEKDQIERILTDTNSPEDWRVGEALAETYMVHQRNCYFPWPDGRDERKTGSSLPGADLVGFQKEGDEDFFAFGEVKTSAEHKYPPGAVYGRTGLKKQIEDLRDSENIRDDLVKYLAYRAVTAQWKDRYENAAKKYMQDNTSVRIFGFLVRDVSPNHDDLRVRVNKLSNGVPASMNIELLAIYLPPDSVGQLSNKVVQFRQGGVG